MDDNDFHAQARAFAALAAPAAHAVRASGVLPEAVRSYLPPPGRTPDALARDGVAASLAGGIIAASGKPHTVEEAIAVFRAVREGLVDHSAKQLKLHCLMNGQ